MKIVGSENRHWRRVRIVSHVMVIFAFAIQPLTPAMSAPATTWDRVKETGRLTLGYRTDAQPFSYKDGSGPPTGYSVMLCQTIVDQMKVEPGFQKLAVEWVPVTLTDRFSAVVQGKIDLMCGADSITLTRRKDVDFSIPIYRGGIGAVLRADAPAALREVLAAGHPPPHPIWRASPARTVLEKKTFSIVAGTSTESWLAERLREFQLDTRVVPVQSYEAGFQRLIDGSSDVLFGDRTILLVMATRSTSEDSLMVLDRLFTDEPLALVFARGDPELRLLVDRTLSRLFRSKEFPDIYAKWFGKLETDEISFFRSSALPE
jgi:polar amino acid transport system substrate-binding protein